jgi:hypothetical protein
MVSMKQKDLPDSMYIQIISMIDMKSLWQIIIKLYR